MPLFTRRLPAIDTRVGRLCAGYSQTERPRWHSNQSLPAWGGGGKGGSRKTVKDDDLFLALHKSGGKSFKNVVSISVTIGIGICKEYRLLIGDRVDIQFDFAEGLGRIFRIQEGGWKLRSTAYSDASKFVGKINRGSFRLTPKEGVVSKVFPEGVIHISAENVVVKSEGILFAFTKRTNGDHNAKK